MAVQARVQAPDSDTGNLIRDSALGLVPETLDDHRSRLAHAGFSRVDVWFRCFNFVSLVAFR